MRSGGSLPYDENLLARSPIPTGLRLSTLPIRTVSRLSGTTYSNHITMTDRFVARKLIPRVLAPQFRPGDDPRFAY
jgi:hypothetical protein